MPRHPFRQAVEARDPEAAAQLLAPDVVFNSPVKFKPFEGRETVAFVLATVLEVVDEFRYTDELAGPDAHALIFRARVGDREIEGLDLLRENAAGEIAELTVMMRPLSALLAFSDEMQKRLEARASGR